MRTFSQATPSGRARLAGLTYLGMFALGLLGAFFRRGILISGDAGATAANIMAHESLYRLAFAYDLLFVATYVVVVALFYHLFKPVSERVSLLAALFGLAGCAILGTSLLFEIAPPLVLGGAKYLSAFSPEQLHAQAYLFLKLYSGGYAISLVFFGFYMFVIGCLVFKSTFLPRTLGVLMAIGGLAGLTFLFPAFAAKYLFTWIAPFDIGEGLLPLWLVVRGVNDERWKEQAASSNR